MRNTPINERWIDGMKIATYHEVQENGMILFILDIVEFAPMPYKHTPNEKKDNGEDTQE